MAKAKLTPIGGRVVAQADKAQSKTASGLYIPDNAQEKSKVATVTAVSADMKHIKVGDKIVYSEIHATTIKLEGEEYLIVNQEHILATVS